MTDIGNDVDQLAEDAKAAAKALEDAAALALAQTRETARQAFDQIKAARERAANKTA